MALSRRLQTPARPAIALGRLPHHDDIGLMARERRPRSRPTGVFTRFLLLSVEEWGFQRMVGVSESADSLVCSRAKPRRPLVRPTAKPTLSRLADG